MWNCGSIDDFTVVHLHTPSNVQDMVCFYGATTDWARLVNVKACNNILILDDMHLITCYSTVSDILIK